MFGQVLDYNIDIVMCIDASISMRHVINQVKDSVMTFPQRISNAMALEDKEVTQLRMKVIVFRDFLYDEQALVESPFFVMGEDDELFANFVANIEAKGGGWASAPKNALEALARAIKSDWVRTGTVRRHVVLMFTDTGALQLGERANSPNYPTDMPKDFAELERWWEEQYMERRAKRLIVFAPDVKPWNEMCWSKCFQVTPPFGEFFNETDLDAFTKCIVGF